MNANKGTKAFFLKRHDGPVSLPEASALECESAVVSCSFALPRDDQAKVIKDIRRNLSLVTPSRHRRIGCTRLARRNRGRIYSTE